MKIKSHRNVRGNDFYWIGECEFCGRITNELPGYHDSYYHDRVIPSIECIKCGKSSSEDFKHLVTVMKI